MKKISVPLARQKNNYTCGHACIIMVCKYFGLHVTQKEVMHACDVSVEDLKKHGLPNRSVAVCLRKLGISCRQRKNSSIVHLTDIAGEVPIIVAYSGRTVAWGHFAVVTGVDHNRLIFNDPISGENFSLTTSDFSKRWRSAYENSHRWMCVATGLPSDGRSNKKR